MGSIPLTIADSAVGLLGEGVSKSLTNLSLTQLNDLVAALVSYWRFNETRGIRYDAHGDNHLTPINVPGRATGKIGYALTLDGTNYLTHDSNASLKVGRIPFGFAVWVKLTNKDADGVVFAKRNPANGQIEYKLFYKQSTDRFVFEVNPTGGTSQTVTASTLGSPTIGTAYLIFVWHDPASSGTIYISGNAGAANSQALTTPIAVHDDAVFQVGAQNGSNGLIGQIDSLYFFKQAFTNDDRVLLYNSGLGIDLTLLLRRLGAMPTTKGVLYRDVNGSFETNEKGDINLYFAQKVIIKKIRSIVTKAIAGSDDATITAKNNAGTGMANGVATHAASAALGNSVSAVPTTNNVISGGDKMTLTLAKTTAGGKVVISVEYVLF